MEQVRLRIETTTSAEFDDDVVDGATFIGLGFADEQPVLLPGAVGRMAFSTRLLSISMRPSSR
jgi:hypothetical protein